jgi:hypothetical protein
LAAVRTLRGWDVFPGESHMKIVSIAVNDTPTYDFFRREVGQLIARTKVKHLSEAQLRAMVDAAVENLRARAFPKSWILQARMEVLREIMGTLVDARRTPRWYKAIRPAARE